MEKKPTYTELYQRAKKLERELKVQTQVAETLKKNEQRLRLALEATEDGIWDWDAATGKIYYSPRYCTMLGYEPNELKPEYETWASLLHPEDRDKAEWLVREHLEGENSSFEMEFRLKTKSGQWKWILGRGKVVDKNEKGTPLRVVGTHLDITDRKKAEEALQLTQFCVDNASIGVYRIANNGRIVDVNQYVSDYTGYTRKELCGMTLMDLDPDGSPVEFQTKWQQVKSSGSYQFETSHRHINGSLIPVEINYNFIEYQGNEFIISFVQDITERKNSEKALHENEDRLHQAVRVSKIGIFDHNHITDNLYWSPQLRKIIGWGPDEPPTIKGYLDLIHPEDRARIEMTVRSSLGRESTGSWDVEHRILRRDKSVCWVTARSNVYFDGEGEKRIPVRSVGAILDITDRKQTEEALERRIIKLTQPLAAAENISFEELFNLSDIQHLQDLYAAAFEVAGLITNPDGTPITKGSNFCRLCSEIIRKNPRGVKNCNYSDAMIGQINPSGPNIQLCLSAGLCNAGASIIVGGQHIANWMIGQVRDDTVDENKVLEYAREIGADEKEFREAYLKVPVMSQKKFETAAQVIFVLSKLISTSAYQNIQQARYIAERKRTEEVLRKFERIVASSQDLMALINRDYIYEAVNERLLKAHNKSRREVVGRMMPEVIGKDVFRRKIQPRLDKALAGQTIQFQEHFDFKGLGRKIVDVSYFPMFDKQGNVKGAVLNARDITETKKLEEQLIQSQKIESIGTLAGGIAHEINNPINGIMNYAQLILDQIKNEGAVMEFAREILHETNRVADIVRNLLTFARHEKQSHSPAQFSDIVSSVLSLVRTVLRHDQIDFQLQVQEDLPNIKCRSQQIQQVLMNLITNARDALNEKYPGYNSKKVLRLSVKRIEKQGRKYVRSTIEDSGAGIQPDNLDRIFDR